MKKVFFAITSLVLLVSCSVKTNEEKARELIEPKVKSNLIKPESYEFAQMQLDSCFSDSQSNPEVIMFSLEVAKLYKEYKEYSEEAERAESSMTIYAPSYGYQSAHSAQQQKKYKAEMEKAQHKAANAKDKIIKLYKDNKQMFMNIRDGKHEFIGWTVIYGYRAETAGGLKTMGENLFCLNKDLTEITHGFTEDDLQVMQSADFDDLKYEFGDELKDIYGDLQ